ncbi:MAG TPA: cytochrome P450 [Acidimicrobiales bacterium]
MAGRRPGPGAPRRRSSGRLYRRRTGAGGDERRDRALGGVSVAGLLADTGIFTRGHRRSHRGPSFPRLARRRRVVRDGTEDTRRHREALEPISVGGVDIAPGEFAMLLIGSANRDPEAFDQPDRFNVGRTENNHLGFGFGIHHCLGAPLARLEAQVALSTPARRARVLDRTGDDLVYKENIVQRGLAALPVELSV